MSCFQPKVFGYLAPCRPRLWAWKSHLIGSHICRGPMRGLQRLHSLGSRAVRCQMCMPCIVMDGCEICRTTHTNNLNKARGAAKMHSTCADVIALWPWPVITMQADWNIFMHVVDVVDGLHGPSLASSSNLPATFSGSRHCCSLDAASGASKASTEPSPRCTSVWRNMALSSSLYVIAAELRKSSKVACGYQSRMSSLQSSG